jgi:hypothetical protein
MTTAKQVDCAGPIIDYADNDKSYTEYYLPIIDEDGNEIKESSLIEWINFINLTGLNILYCGTIIRDDMLNQEFYLCIIHNELIKKSFPNLTSSIERLNLMSVQALRFIEYFPKIVEYSYLIYKELNDAFLSIQIAHYKYIAEFNNDLSSTYTWINTSYQPLFKTNQEFNNKKSFTSGINELFFIKYKNCYDSFNQKKYDTVIFDVNKSIYRIIFGGVFYDGIKYIESNGNTEVVGYLKNNEFKNFIKYFENE